MYLYDLQVNSNSEYIAKRITSNKYFSFAVTDMRNSCQANTAAY